MNKKPSAHSAYVSIKFVWKLIFLRLELFTDQDINNSLFSFESYKMFDLLQNPQKINKRSFITLKLEAIY